MVPDPVLPFTGRGWPWTGYFTSQTFSFLKDHDRHCYWTLYVQRLSCANLVLSFWLTWPYFILITSSGSRHFYPHFSDQETEALGDSIFFFLRVKSWDSNPDCLTLKQELITTMALFCPAPNKESCSFCSMCTFLCVLWGLCPLSLRNPFETVYQEGRRTKTWVWSVSPECQAVRCE